MCEVATLTKCATSDGPIGPCLNEAMRNNNTGTQGEAYLSPLESKIGTQCPCILHSKVGKKTNNHAEHSRGGWVVKRNAASGSVRRSQGKQETRSP